MCGGSLSFLDPRPNHNPITAPVLDDVAEPILNELDRFDQSLDAQVGALGDFLEGESFIDSLANALAAGQGYATDSIDRGFGRAGEAVADYGRGLTAAEGKNIRSVDENLDAMMRGDFKTFDDQQREFIRDPYVFPILMAAASYFGASSLAPYLSGAAASAGVPATVSASGTIGGAAGAVGGAATGALVGAGGATVAGDSNLTDATLSGAVGGAVSGYGAGSSFTDNRVLDSAIKQGVASSASSAARGDSGNDILRAGTIGAASGAAGTYLGDTFDSKAAAQFGSAATNMGLSRMWESEAQKDAYDPYQWALDYYSRYNNQQKNSLQSIIQEGTIGDELALSPSGANLLSMFEAEQAPIDGGVGSGQYGSTLDQIASSEKPVERMAG